MAVRLPSRATALPVIARHYGRAPKRRPFKALIGPESSVSALDQTRSSDYNVEIIFKAAFWRLFVLHGSSNYLRSQPIYLTRSNYVISSAMTFQRPS